MLSKLGKALKALIHWRYRSSETGQFITKEEAERHPSTTQRERAP